MPVCAHTHAHTYTHTHTHTHTLTTSIARGEVLEPFRLEKNSNPPSLFICSSPLLTLLPRLSPACADAALCAGGFVPCVHICARDRETVYSVCARSRFVCVCVCVCVCMQDRERERERARERERERERNSVQAPGCARNTSQFVFSFPFSVFVAHYKY
jgi:hypothetical protein